MDSRERLCPGPGGVESHPLDLVEDRDTVQSFDFMARAQEAEESILTLLTKTVSNEGLKLVLRLKAADMLLSRTRPTLKSVEVKSNQNVNIYYMSPAAIAKEINAGTLTSLPSAASVEEEIRAQEEAPVGEW